MSRVLSRAVVTGGVVYPAGTAATPELEEKIQNPAHWTGEASESEKGYDGLKVAELKDEIAKRNEGRDEADLISAEGNKADLVAALEADDES